MFSSNTSQVSSDALFVEDVFSTTLYQGNGSTQTITNGIDLAGEGGLVWIKDRTNANNNVLTNTDSGLTKFLYSNSTSAELTSSNVIQSVSSDGFVIGPAGAVNGSGAAIASWTFRKAEKFFDVVTYTGDGTAGRQISHSLSSAAAAIIIKRTDAATNWVVYHKDLTAGANLQLNTTSAQITGNYYIGNGSSYIAPTSTNFSVAAAINASGGTYVAYLFAHNAGGFGLTGTDNVISCGSFTTDASGNGTFQNLGYEPQWVMVKNITSAEDWVINDNMRGMRANPAGSAQALFPNTSGAEVNYGLGVNLGATGFTGFGSGSKTYIYIAIRRGPMKTPTSGTSVYSTDTFGSTSPNPPAFDSANVVDAALFKNVTAVSDISFYSRLTGTGQLLTTSTAAEATNAQATFDYQQGWYNNASTVASVRSWMFRRAPGFFDEVCYTGDATSNRSITHNLGAIPELVIVKQRSAARAWAVYSSALTQDDVLFLNTTAAKDPSSGVWGTTAFTSTTFRVGNYTETNISGGTYVAYLFASCPGVSKVGSYTGNGSTQTINCGFTGGARFVLIKRTDSTGDWYVWDSARGIVAGNDPYLLLNSTAAEVTSTDYIDTYSAGFEISSTAPAAINASGGTFIYLAIA